MAIICKLEGRIIFPTNQTIRIDESISGQFDIVVVLAGEYFFNTIDGATPALLQFIEDEINTGPLVDTYDVTMNDDAEGSDGKITFQRTGTDAFTITWTSAVELREALGFTGVSTSTPSASHSSGYQPHPLFLPNCARGDVKAGEPTASTQEFGAPSKDFTFAIAPSGQSTGYGYEETFGDTLRFKTLKGYKTGKNFERTGRAYESLESFWREVFAEGLDFRFHPDRSNDALWFPLVVSNPQTFEPSPHVEDWWGQEALFAIGFEVVKYVP